MRRQAFWTAIAAVLVVGLLGVPAGAATGPDLSVGLSGPSGTPGLFESFDVIVSVMNHGTESASEATLGLWTGDALRIDGIHSTDPTDACEETYPGELHCDLGSLAPGAVVSFNFEMTRMISREVWIDAWTDTSSSESDYDDNYAGIQLGPDKSNQADVAVTASAPDQPDVGQEYDSTFTVTDRGPGRAQDVKLDISLPEKNTFVSWSSSDAADTCTLHEETYDEEGFEGGPYVYRSLRCELGTMQFAQQAIITVTQVRDNAYESWAGAYVRTASYDENYDNDWAEMFMGGHPSVTSDLAVTHTAPEETPLVGSDYEVVFNLANTGPVAAPETLFGTYVPDGFELRSISVGGDHACTEDAWGGITCDLGSLEVGETETVILAMTRTKARETWIYAWLDSPNYDPQYENDYVEFQLNADTSDPADVAVKIEGPLDPEVGSTFTTTSTITNKGPNVARNVEVHHSLPEWSTFESVTSSDPTDVCELHEETYDDEVEAGSSEEPYVFREVRCDLGDLAVGESTAIQVSAVRVEKYDMWASVWAETASYDENYENDWDEWNSTGEYGYDDCYESGDGKAVACDYAEGGGAANGSIAFKAGSRRDSTVSAGAGSDTVVVGVPIGGKRERRIVIRAGRGNDDVTVNVAPGARNVVIVVRAGSGNDTVDIEAPRTGAGVRIIVKGGAGRDRLLGGEHADLMWGGPGKDRLEGSGGNDRLAGGRGRDVCIGGPGTDERIGC